MRKHLIRWWYTPNWERDLHRRAMLQWNGHFSALFPDPCDHLWVHYDGITGEEFAASLEGEGYAIRDTNGTSRSLRQGIRGYLKNPFTPEEEIVFDEWPQSPRRANSLHITEIDHKAK